MVKQLAAVLLAVWALTFGEWSARAEQGAQLQTAGAEVQEGMRLYQAKCAVCHVPATRGAEPYGPRLSKMQVAGEDTALKAIQSGGARMPGFQYALNPSQISAIMAFLKTLDSPPERIVLSAPNSP